MDRFEISPAFVTAGLLWAAAARTPADDDLYIGLNHERLFAAMGIRQAVITGPVSTSIELQYLMRRFEVVEPNGPRVEVVDIGVFPSVEKAVRGSRFWNLAQIRNVPALPAGRTAPGDHFEWHRSSEGSAHTCVGGTWSSS